MTAFLTTVAATEAMPSGIDALGIDPWAILAQAVTFLVLFWIIKKFAMDKIVATLEQRRRTIDDGVRLGLEMEAQQAQLDKHAAEIMQNARVEAENIIAEGRKEAAGLLKEAETNAADKAEAIIAEAHTRIDEDIKKSRQQLESEMRVLVAEATETILQEKIDAQKDDNLIQKAIKAVRNV